MPVSTSWRQNPMGEVKDDERIQIRYNTEEQVVELTTVGMPTQIVKVTPAEWGQFLEWVIQNRADLDIPPELMDIDSE